MDPLAFWWQEFEAELSKDDPDNVLCNPNQLCSYMVLSYTTVSSPGSVCLSFLIE